MKYEAMMFENVVNIVAARTGLVHTHLHTLCVDTFIPEGDVALGDDLTADSAPTSKYFYPAHVKIFVLTWWCCSTRRSKLRSPSRRTSPPVASCRTCTWQQTDQCCRRSIGFTIGFHNHREGPYQGLLLVESAYQRFHIKDTIKTMLMLYGR